MAKEPTVVDTITRFFDQAGIDRMNIEFYENKVTAACNINNGMVGRIVVQGVKGGPGTAWFTKSKDNKADWPQYHCFILSTEMEELYNFFHDCFIHKHRAANEKERASFVDVMDKFMESSHENRSAHA